MDYSKEINLEVNRQYYIPIEIQQYDAGYPLKFKVLNRGVAFNLSNLALRVKADKPDGTIIFNDLVLTDAAAGKCEFNITTQFTSVAGIVNVQLDLREGNKILNTIIFRVFVRPSINVDSIIESKDEFTALTSALKQVEDWDKYFEETSGKLEEKYTTRLNQIDSQLEDIANKKADKNDVGTPLSASNVLEMIDKTKVYVNTTDGKWYSWDGTTWIPNGIYNSFAIGERSISNNKLVDKSCAILNSLSKNVSIIVNGATDFQFEYGVVHSDGSFLPPQTTLNNVRTIKKYKVDYLKIELLASNIMIKVVYYNSEGIYINDSGWLSKVKTDFTTGGTTEYTISNYSNIVICLADTTLNNTGQFTVTVAEMLTRIRLIENISITTNGGFIDSTHIKEKTLDASVFKDGVLNRDNVAIIDGEIKLPSEFGILPFDIIKENNRYNISLSDKQLNINPVVVYVSDSAISTGLGTDKSQPITLKQIKQNFTNNLYYSKNIKIKFIDNIYFMSAISDFDLIGTGQDNTVTNLTIESEIFTWIGYGKKNVVWTQYDTNTALYTTIETKKVSDLADVENLKNNGLPNLYIKKTSLDEVVKEGDFCQVGGKVYVYPYSINDINKINLIYGFDYSADKNIPGIITIRKNTKGNMIFKNIGMFLDCLNLRDLKSLDVWYYFFNCRFHRNSMDSLALNGKYKAVLVNCIADYGSKDNFNYHSTSKDSVAIELNCKSYGAGQYKLDTVGVNTTKDSCNGSTAHDGMCIARFGCSYWDCEGSVVADVNNCVTYGVDCSVKNILSTISNINYKAAFMLHDNRFSSTIYRPNDNHKNYLINCVGGGENVTWGVRSEGMKVDIANFKGNTTHYSEGENDFYIINDIIV